MICDVIKFLRIFICFPKEVSVNKSDRREPHNENVMELKLNKIRSLGIGASSLRVRQLWPDTPGRKPDSEICANGRSDKLLSCRGPRHARRMAGGNNYP